MASEFIGDACDCIVVVVNLRHGDSRTSDTLVVLGLGHFACSTVNPDLESVYDRTDIHLDCLREHRCTAFASSTDCCLSAGQKDGSNNRIFILLMKASIGSLLLECSTLYTLAI